MSNQVNKNTQIKLKKLAGIDSLSALQIREILEKSIQWITNFYSEAAGNKKVKGNFAIENFSYGGEFDLSTAQDILNNTVPIGGKEPFLFLSDLVNFVEQIRTSLNSNKISLTSLQRQELDRLGNTFNLIGIIPSNEKITLEELKKIENFDYSRRVVERIKLIYIILKPSIEILEAETVQVETKIEEKKAQDKEIKEVAEEKENATNNQEEESSEEQTNQQKPPDEKPPLKISELDPQSKLYLQSLSIITINQALSKYFNEASLAKIGLPPGTVITFDQLPLAIRQQLMDRAFSQVENLLISGQFSLDKLISEPAQRINFSNQAALGLLMDVHGLNLLNTAVRDIARYGEKKISANEKEQLTEEQLGPRAKNEKSNILNSQQAEKLLEENKDNLDFAKIIESELNIVGDESQLDDIFSRKIREITGYQDETRIRLVIENVRPLIEVFIQQGLPPEYLIPDPKNFDYNRFINVFGKSLDKEVFDAHKEELANLIIFYWKRKRAIWATEVRQEFALEKYTPEQAQQLFEEIKKDPQKLAALRNLGTLNLTYGGRQITEELAGLANPSSPEMEAFQTQQKVLIEKYLEAEIAKLSKTEQQKTLKVFFDFYTPGVVYQEYSIEIFQSQIAPQINPMDFYMLQMADEFGPEAFTADGGGYVQRAFAPGGNYQGTDFMDSAVGQAGKKLATKALSEGLYLALDAAGGWGEALRAAETAAPIIKKLKEQLIEMGLEKVIEIVKKYWPFILLGLILAALASLLPWLLLLIPAYFLIKNGFGGLRDLFSGANELLVGQNGGVNQVGVGAQATLENQAAASQLPQGAKTILNQFSSSAMVTAGQAVIATVGVTTVFVFVYQTSLNSAFLTDFPINDSGNISSVEKTSKYAEIEKTAKITKGCLGLDSNGTKCENPSFPVSVEYSVTIKPKEDFSLQITNIQDEIKFKQSKKGWEESGRPMPSIEQQRTLDFSYFQNLIAEQVGLSNSPLETTPTPSYSPENTSNTGEPSSSSGEFIVIPAGKSLTFTYTLEDLDSNYNHTAILNTVEANFYYQNAFIAGTDNVITAARVCLGNCSAGAGCWPTTGSITQLPFGVGTPDSDATHRPPVSYGYSDAYDIGGNGGHPNVFVPFPGNLCFRGCSDTGYGCYYVLTFDNSGASQKLLFAHFESPNAQLSEAESCMNVDEGFLIGPMGNRGNSTGTHLHYEVDYGGQFYHPSSRNFSILETLVPETNNGNYPPKLGDGVSTCYE